ncbi:MAG: Crp/Fnr family transcriptional regulator [Ignavibacteriaceae bacterium]|nr:Crp/Fnr family transcriptional regulator [Ignavibacteriaceae bacterium]
MSNLNPALSLISSFAPLSAESADLLDSIMTEAVYSRNTILLEIGQIPFRFHFVKKGLARIYYIRGEEDVTDYFAIDNQFIGAVPALFTGKPSHKAIQVLEDSEIISFRYSDFEELCASKHDIEHAGRKMALFGFLEGQQRVESIRFLSARERYEELERKYPGIANRAPLKYIASYLGITQVSLSRIRAGTQ